MMIREGLFKPEHTRMDHWRSMCIPRLRQVMLVSEVVYIWLQLMKSISPSKVKAAMLPLLIYVLIQSSSQQGCHRLAGNHQQEH